MKKILFQGDSITGANRLRDREKDLGGGYAMISGASLQCRYPNHLEIINRGVNSDMCVQMYARLKRDCISLAPDYVSILIGINDVWELDVENTADDGRYDKFEKIYGMFIEETRSALPNVRFIMMSPFITRGRQTDPSFELHLAETWRYIKSCERVGARFDIPVIPLQKYFDEAVKLAPPEYWTVEGIHPTAAGHMLIAKQWLRAFEEHYIKNGEII